MGSGYTGLWTALSLVEQSPSTKVLIVEKEISGFGASGRNGGWVSALFPASAHALIKRHGRNAATAMRRAMVECVPSVGAWASRLDIECDFVAGGTTSLARSTIQRQRAMESLEDDYYEDLDEKSTSEIIDSLLQDKPLKPKSFRNRINTAPEKNKIETTTNKNA